MRPNESLLLGTPACPPGGLIAPVVVPVIAEALETLPTDETATPAAVTPKPARNLRRDGSGPCLVRSAIAGSLSPFRRYLQRAEEALRTLFRRVGSTLRLALTVVKGLQ
jgi:hypothetical protein